MTFQRRVLSVALAVIMSAAAHTAAAQTFINSCREFTQPGSYQLTADLSGKSFDGVACFRIRSSNVTLDLGGHTIRGFNGVPAYGVSTDGSIHLGIHVRNGVVADFGNGIFLASQFGAVLENLQVNVNKNSGLVAGNGAVIQHVRASQNRQGITAGAGSFVNDVYVESSGSDGLSVGLGSWVASSKSEFNAGWGIVLDRTLLGTANSIFANTTGANGKGGISADCAGGVLQPNAPLYLGLSVVGNVTDPFFPDHGPHVVANVPVVRTYTAANGTQYVPEQCQALDSDAVVHKSDAH